MAKKSRSPDIAFIAEYEDGTSHSFHVPEHQIYKSNGVALLIADERQAQRRLPAGNIKECETRTDRIAAVDAAQSLTSGIEYRTQSLPARRVAYIGTPRAVSCPSQPRFPTPHTAVNLSSS